MSRASVERPNKPPIDAIKIQQDKKEMRRLATALAVVALVAVAAAPASAQQTKQNTDVVSYADLADVGDARLFRTSNAVVAKAKATNIPTGVYTMWWVVWNTPEGCATPFACDVVDLFDPEGDTGLAIGYAGGAVVGPGGNLSIAVQLKEGKTLRGFPYTEHEALGLSLPETSLVDSDHAEVHLVLRSHQDLIPGMVSSQLGTFNGGCAYGPPIDQSEPIYGVPGPNTCSDQFFAVFPSTTQ